MRRRRNRPRLKERGSAVKQARSLDAVVGRVGAYVALDCIGAGRGGVCSADDAGVAGAGDRSRIVVEAVQTPEFVDDQESLIGLLECGASTLNTTDLLTTNVCALSSPPAILGDVGDALVSVLGSVPGGIRKVKSMNCLVEALASPEQRRTVVVARARRGRGRPAKTRVLIEAGSDVVNASLTDSDIQECKLEIVTQEVVSRLWYTDSVQFLSSGSVGSAGGAVDTGGMGVRYGCGIRTV
ncbi:hypothetical protein V6N12_033920 [Hibiscus sabdariffa]|uniref:Uncharacterized protein n=1 Tax=Hibiscus sabdariffa TaxID=183260 RepID=A0ABR2APD5_9ROSI